MFGMFYNYLPRHLVYNNILPALGNTLHANSQPYFFCSSLKMTTFFLFYTFVIIYSSVQFSHSVVSMSLRPHALRHARLPCSSPTPGACSNSCPLMMPLVMPSNQKHQFFGAQLSLEKAMTTHSSTLAWKIPWTEEPGRLQSLGSLQVGHN